MLTWNEDVIDNQRIFKRITPYYFEKCLGNKKFSEKKLLTNISGNKSSDNPKELYSERKRIVKFFEKNYPEQFDLYGIGWNKEEFPSYQGAPENKIEVYHNYKFALALENTKDVKGYVTEKIYDCLVAGIVPIYMGADDILLHVPGNCFIDYTQFDSLEQLADFLFSMSEEEYNRYQQAMEAFLAGDVQSHLDGTVYARNILYVMQHGQQQGFELASKAKWELKTKLIRERISLWIRRNIKKVLKNRK